MGTSEVRGKILGVLPCHTGTRILYSYSFTLINGALTVARCDIWVCSSDYVKHDSIRAFDQNWRLSILGAHKEWKLIDDERSELFSIGLESSDLLFRII